MNPVEIADAVDTLARQPFDSVEFPFQFLRAFDTDETTIKRLRASSSNKNDIDGAVLKKGPQHKRIRILVVPQGEVTEGLRRLRESQVTKKAVARFILATDGIEFQAEDLDSGDVVACEYVSFPDYFGFFLPLAGIETVARINENTFDIKAVGRLNRLYLELLKENPDWKTEETLRHEMNRFLVKLVFCFYAEDTGIFTRHNFFTQTVEQMSAPDSSNTHDVISTIFQAMNTEDSSALPGWVSEFPYVNGGLFSGNNLVPRFSRIAQRYLHSIGELDWKQINPDIFGSMIQGVANDAERGNLGMHYTSVPNILKVLNPLFLDDLRHRLEEAGTNSQKLSDLKKRIARIRVFDPACGSGNFLVIAYKQMREIENGINIRCGKLGAKSIIPLTNFRGIEIQDFAAEIARLSLVIAEFQCNAQYLGNQEAIHAVLPLSKQNWIICGNALRLDWRTVCPSESTAVRLGSDDLFEIPLKQSEIDFENEGGEVYICGNPPYAGKRQQNKEQKEDMFLVFDKVLKNWRSLDYITGWFVKAAQYCTVTNASAAFVATNSVCQGSHVSSLWPYIQKNNCQIVFAYQSFKWRNLARYNAGVTVVIVCISAQSSPKRLFSEDGSGQVIVKNVSNINGYLLEGEDIFVKSSSKPLCNQPEMNFGNMAIDKGYLLLDREEMQLLQLTPAQQEKFIRRHYGSEEFINGRERYCLWIADEHLDEAKAIPSINARIESVRRERLDMKDGYKHADRPHQMREMNCGVHHTIIIPSVSSENRDYLPCGLLGADCIVSNAAFALYDAPLWTLALISSRLHMAWVSVVCGQLETRLRYSNTLGWNTFPIPVLTQKNKDDLIQNAERILEIRESHFPKTIADLYSSDAMPDELKMAHAMNDEIVERIYIGRRFRNDSERLQKLFSMYAALVQNQAVNKAVVPSHGRRK